MNCNVTLLYILWYPCDTLEAIQTLDEAAGERDRARGLSHPSTFQKMRRDVRGVNSYSEWLDYLIYSHAENVKRSKIKSEIKVFTSSSIEFLGECIR